MINSEPPDARLGSGTSNEEVQMAATCPVRIVQTRAMSYKVPGNGPVRTNYLVVLQAEDGTGTRIRGVGEGQPRGQQTGDAADSSWAFLQAALERLHGTELPTQDPASNDSILTVRALMQEFSALAGEYAGGHQSKRPYRGTLLGVETALLDLVGHATGLPLCDILGRVRDEAPVIPPPVRPDETLPSLRTLLNGQRGRYSTVRVLGDDDVEGTADFLDLVGLMAASRGIRQAEKPLWLEMGANLDRERASALVAEIADSVRKDRLPNQVYLEQPVLMRYADHLPVLQQEADDLMGPDCGSRSLTIIGDESIWDTHSYGRLRKLGGIRSVTIRPAQAGGLLPSLDLARAVTVDHPDARIVLMPMLGAGRLTQSALRHLALALPQIDGVGVGTFELEELPFALVDRAELGNPAIAEDCAECSEKPDGVVVAGVAGDQVFVDDAGIEDDSGDEDEQLAEDEDATGASLGERSALTEQGVFTVEERELHTIEAETLPGLGIRIDYGPLIGATRRFAAVPKIPVPKNEGRLPTRYDNVEDVRPLGPNGTKGYLLEKRALARGLSTTRYSKSAFVAYDDANPAVYFKWSRSSVSSAVAISVCTHKEATRMVLEDAGVPTPQGRTFRTGDYDSARAFVDHIGFPVVVKPSMGIRGIGVIAGIEDTEQLESAFELMKDSRFGGQDFIVEKHIAGRDHRILVVGGEVVAAIQRKPASVLGDGRSSIAELLIHRNAARRSNPHLWTRPAKFDGTMSHQLSKLGLTLDAVLPAGEEVMLSNTANISQGADSIDVFDTLHPTIIQACERAVAAVPGMQYCGVDFLLEDPARSLESQDAAIIELNAHAAIGNCEYPMFGSGRQVAQKLMDLTIDQMGLQASAPRDELTVHITIRGKVTRVGYRKWLERHAQRIGAKGWVRNLNSRTVEAVINGPTERVAPLVASCIIGPSDALPTSYNATVFPATEAALPETNGFVIRSRPDHADLSVSERDEVQRLAQAEQEPGR